MENHDDPTPRNKKGWLLKSRGLKAKKADAAEKGRIYGIDSLSLVENWHEAENDSLQGEDNASGHDSKLLLEHRRIGQMANNINKDKV